MISQRSYITAALISFALFLSLGLLLPKYQNIFAMRAALGEREKILNERSEIIQNINLLSAEYENRSADIAKLASLIPETKETAELVSALENIATRSGLQLNNLKLTEEKSDKTKSAYNTLAADMTLNGSYLSFLIFLDNLEKNIRIIDVASFEITPKAALTNILTINLKANAYFLK
ncbi:MAG: hypothetical protein A2750_04060 [Candidatus Yanofskybacteria bacterium RIFCSPHIGHO2_01_FULL_45_42]|uniref:Pilus assembly protein PilO n=2 Tax=Candidatus Yanofskyibacteriota TaxID=1752733 RepID=A0A1F8EZ22_9BACT|nr:MAG: hypothetical protein A2750_04060 [Candidatus Yanofskybacteria bacterium RIFCSPHIGHO2_01_FULL_45_42]OGN15399.1 MAG: hypothetical protein A3C81_01535 [Candidatus Yanofskybacteria bacterium RIFCSPHIGHO2_02_FULL_46_19]OGN28238.1 MAG: hypothetical protein A3B17_02000 [Candidatus Yanofskybacteria bacterium RIFCSPLOWO2_01_FULL_45_72]